MGSDEERSNIADEEEKAEKARQKKFLQARELIEKQKIPCPTELPSPIAPGTVKKATTWIQTNYFGIRMDDPDKKIYKYEVHMEGVVGSKIVEFTKTGRSDHLASHRKANCMAIFEASIKAASFYNEGIVFFYDGQHLLFTTVKLHFRNPETAIETIILEGKECGADLENFSQIRTTIKECEVAEGGESRLSDVRVFDTPVKDRSVQQFLDVATSMNALVQSGRFTVFGKGKVFPNNPDQEGLKALPMREGKLMIPGMTKSIKLIEGPKGRSNASPAMSVDSLKVVFHDKGKLLEKALLIISNIDRANEHEISIFASMVKGLGCKTLHTRKARRIEIYGISKENSTKRIEVKLEGISCAVSVEEYFSRKYNLALTHPLAPLVMSKSGDQVNLYPMEVLEVVPMQRVTVAQSSSAQSQVATKECAVPPAVRQNAIMEQCTMHDLFNPEQLFLKAAGVSILPVPLRTEARILKGPILKYARSEMEVEGVWRPPQNAAFIVGASVEKWVLYAVLSPGDRFTLADMRRFVDVYMRRCKDKGMKIVPPKAVEILSQAPQGQPVDGPARDKLREAAYENCSLVMFITNDNITIHNHIKLQERYSSVVTQDLKLSTVQRFLEKNQMLTLDNIIYKTNEKMGGINYGISLRNVVGPNVNPFPPSRLILGIGLSHAPQMEVYTEKGVQIPSPTVVGYSANMGNHPTEFIGDMLYQDKRKEDILLCIPEMIQNVLDRFTGMVYDAGQGKKVQGERTRPLPQELIIYRQGVAEGFYALCLNEEVPLIKAVLAKNGAKDVKITYIVVQKDHGVRLMPVEINIHDKPTAQNIGSGVVIDEKITHPRYKEFYLNSHITLQGSARTPKYTLIADENNLTMNELESVTHALCYNFQIVNSPVSIPSPLYVANRYAERGVALYQAKATDELATSDQKKRKTNDDMNEDLSYDRTPLGAVRVNA